MTREEADAAVAVRTPAALAARALLRALELPSASLASFVTSVRGDPYSFTATVAGPAGLTWSASGKTATEALSVLCLELLERAMTQRGHLDAAISIASGALR